MLEPTALKGARWVLRGGSGSNATSLPDGERFSGDAAADLQRFLEDNDIPYEPWSRVGE
jgi:hypothetical protein